MRTDAQRIANYNARMQSSLIDPTLTAVNENALTNYQTYILEFYPLQVAMRAILSAAGEATYLWGRYEALNGEFYRAWKTSTGPTLVARFDEITAKWVARGCTLAVVTDIASDVYTVTLTPP
jgi:hypothetical protein